ncbi:hypothetical protein [Streptomyces sp. MBT84]
MSASAASSTPDGQPAEQPGGALCWLSVVVARFTVLSAEFVFSVSRLWD